MLTNSIICNSEEQSKNIEEKMRMSLGDVECLIKRKKVIVCGVLTYSVDIEFGKKTEFDTTIDVNLNTGFGIVR